MSTNNKNENNLSTTDVYKKLGANEEFVPHSASINELEEKLQTNVVTGLTNDEASRRLDMFGENKLKEAKKKSIILMFLQNFTDPLVILLLICAIISIVFASISQELGDWVEVGIILGVVIINSVIGTAQEAKAEKALDALKKLSSPLCTVKREDKLKEIPASELVVGDLVILEEGRIIPADLRFIQSIDLKSDESSLTGESVPVSKDVESVALDTPIADQACMGRMSCPISYGRGAGIVTSTGMNTEIGKIAGMLNDSSNDETPLQKKLKKLSKFLGIICIVVCVLMLIVSICWNISNLKEEWFHLVKEAIAVAVAAIPEGLPAVVTIVLAMGVSKMVKVNTIVRKLPSVETLGSVTTVCSDKTGTLTQNRMTIKEVYIDGQTLNADEATLEQVELIARGMMLCSNASINGDRYGDPTELALLDYAFKHGMEKEIIESTSHPRVNEMPFDSVRKMMSTQHLVEGDKKIIYTKGAMDQILKNATHILCNGEIRPITQEDIEQIEQASKEMASKALRVLAFAIHEDEEINESNLVYVGMVGMIDPPRPEAKGAVQEFKNAGIRTIMITGDHRDTALAIGRELDIAQEESQCCSGDELNLLNEEELKEKVKTTNIFARVSPENKVQIVNALRANGEIVSMTGDGVNDAPSLKQADIGIAMGITGTDVAKGAADMILTDDNFASIKSAVEEGRGIFVNIKKSIFFLLSSNFAEVLIMFTAALCGFPTPLLAIHILFVNLVTDSLPAVALGRDDKQKDIMKEKPRNPKDGIFAHGGFAFCLGYGAVIFVITTIAFFIPIWQYLGTSGATINTYVTGSIADQITNLGGTMSSGFTTVNVNLTGVNFQDFIYNFDNLLKSVDPARAQELILSHHAVLDKAQTYAFTTLAVSELFHMLGMTDIKRSVINIYKNKNYMLWVSFAFGLGLQVLITEVNVFAGAFQVTPLAYYEWFYLIAICAVPLIIHECLVPVFKNRQVL